MNFLNLKNKYNKEKGFTLTEIIVYVGLLAIFTIAVMNIFLSITGIYKRVQAVRKIENTALFAVDRITREIKNSTTIDYANTVWGSSSNASLSLNSNNASGTAQVIRFYRSGNQVLMNRDGALVGPLSTDSVVISGLSFEQVSSSSSESVKISISIESPDSTEYIIKSFYNTATLRGSY